MENISRTTVKRMDSVERTVTQLQSLFVQHFTSFRETHIDGWGERVDLADGVGWGCVGGAGVEARGTHKDAGENERENDIHFERSVGGFFKVVTQNLTQKNFGQTASQPKSVPTAAMRDGGQKREQNSLPRRHRSTTHFGTQKEMQGNSKCAVSGSALSTASHSDLLHAADGTAMEEVCIYIFSTYLLYSNFTLSHKIFGYIF